jgi:hypothetical protein
MRDASRFSRRDGGGSKNTVIRAAAEQACTFEFPRFKKAVRSGLVVTDSLERRVDQGMEPGSVVEEATAIAVPSVAYDSPRATGATFTKTIIEASRVRRVPAALHAGWRRCRGRAAETRSRPDRLRSVSYISGAS